MQTLLRFAIAGATTAQVDRGSTPRPDSSTTVGDPDPVHTNRPTVLAAGAFAAGASSPPPQPATSTSISAPITLTVRGVFTGYGAAMQDALVAGCVGSLLAG